MTSSLMHDLAKAFDKKRPDLRPGYTVRVHEKVKEGEKERVQIFEGLIIAIHRGHVASDTSFTVRRIASGVGVEKIFSLYSPTIEKIDVKKIAKVRRAKLSFLRGRKGKSARMSERFTKSDEFAIATAVEEAPATPPEQEVVEEKAAESV